MDTYPLGFFFSDIKVIPFTKIHVNDIVNFDSLKCACDPVWRPLTEETHKNVEISDQR